MYFESSSSAVSEWSSQDRAYNEQVLQLIDAELFQERINPVSPNVLLNAPEHFSARKPRKSLKNNQSEEYQGQLFNVLNLDIYHKDNVEGQKSFILIESQFLEEESAVILNENVSQPQASEPYNSPPSLPSSEGTQNSRLFQRVNTRRQTTSKQKKDANKRNDFPNIVGKVCKFIFQNLSCQRYASKYCKRNNCDYNTFQDYFEGNMPKSFSQKSFSIYLKTAEKELGYKMIKVFIIIFNNVLRRKYPIYLVTKGSMHNRSSYIQEKQILMHLLFNLFP